MNCPPAHFLEYRERYSSHYTIRMIKSRKIRWAGRTPRMGTKPILLSFSKKILKVKDQYEDLGKNKTVILKRILQKQDGRVLIGLIWLRIEASYSLFWIW
jgi:hypothetical protein